MSTSEVTSPTTSPEPDPAPADGQGRTGGQLRAFARVVHPRQAVVTALVVGGLVALMGRPLREVLVSAAAVLVVQLALGVVNDVSDVEDDRRSGVEGKPVADGTVPVGNATFAVAALLLLAIPLSLQSGIVAGVFLLASVAVGFVHDRWLHRGALSWVGWSATFALLTFFVAYGGWGQETEGSAPVTTVVVLAAVLGVLVHFLTTLPDLVADNAAGVRNLPLRVALRTGAPKLLVITGVLTLLVTGALVWTALTVGVAR